MASDIAREPSPGPLEGVFATAYGSFDPSGREYRVLRPDTPRPWVNVISNGDYGLVVSQAGSGYSWRTHATLNRLTRWEQDLVGDAWGKYCYLRDDQDGTVWSATWKPLGGSTEGYTCRHGVGYSVFEACRHGIASTLTVFVAPSAPLEFWRVRIENRSDRARAVSLISYLEWCLGEAPEGNREFHTAFFDSAYDPAARAVLVTKRLWTIPAAGGLHWNRDWAGVAFHAVDQPVRSFSCDRAAFLGRYGSVTDPRAVREGRGDERTGSWADAVASLQVPLHLRPGESRDVVFVVGAADDRAAAERLVAGHCRRDGANAAWQGLHALWRPFLDRLTVRTPDPGFDLLQNTWLKYQAISGRLWGRTGYYQPGGAYGFRDQLQDSLVFLPLDPARTKAQVLLHAAHQFLAGDVYHWWHPITEQGSRSRHSDDLLWLVFVTLEYLDETDDETILDALVPYVDGPAEPLFAHCRRALDRALARFSPRGLPLIGEGDWNDALHAAGAGGRGESIWLGHFLYGVLRRFAGVAEARGVQDWSSTLLARATALRRALNRHGWDGAWYTAATCDDGTVVGSARCTEGRIFLNPQTWAVLSGVASGARARQVMEAVATELQTRYGPALLMPAYRTVNPAIGYLTRYAPGVRENGGIYTHAAIWAILAECRLGRGDQAYQLYTQVAPPWRGMDPERYTAEPYVTAGSIEGPDSAHFGRGGWTWYSGSAAWLFRAGLEGILGLRATRAGLVVAPCMPAAWDGFTVHRWFRGATYHVVVQNPAHVSRGVRELVVDGRRQRSPVITPHGDGRVHEVRVVMGLTERRHSAVPR